MPAKKLFILLLVFLPGATPLYCQVDSFLNVYSHDFYHEKMHVHFDRTVYVKGETVYYKVYLLTEDNSFTKNKNLYADWYDEDGKLLTQTVAPIFFSGASGSFTIPANYKGRSIELKAYTQWMLNFDTAFIYSQVVQVYQPSAKTANANAINTQSSTLQFYPEGGFSVAGLTNHIAFKATDSKGLPMAIQGVIKNAKGEVIDEIASVHDGMGAFDLFMENNETYNVEWQDANNIKSVTTITAQKAQGLCLGVHKVQGKTQLIVERTQQVESTSKSLHLLIHKDQSLYYKLDFEMSDKTKIAYNIPTTEIPDDITQCTLFDKNWVPLAERVIFINNHKHSFNCNIDLGAAKLIANSKNEITIAVNDTLVSNMSVAITDYDLFDKTKANIFTDFLLCGDLRGHVYNAAYYIPSDTANSPITDSVVASHLDLLMLTQGHRRFDWEKIIAGQLPVMKYPQDTSYLQVKGKLFSRKISTYNEGVFINGLLQTKDSTKSILVLNVNKDGSFADKDRFFYDTARLFYSLGGNFKKNTNYHFSFDNGLLTDSARQQYFQSANKIDATPKITFAYTDASALNQRMRQYSDASTLQEVVVTTKTKTPLQILDQYYARGMYAGENNNYAFDLEEDGHAPNYANIFLYLEAKVPGFRVGHGGPVEIPLWYAGTTGTPEPPAFLLDEVPVSIDAIRNIPINDIAYVKAFKPPFLGALLDGASGVIALYSKRGYSPLHDDQNTSGLPYAVLKGYTKFKEFTNNDDAPTSSTPNYSPTVYWNPVILTDKNNHNFTLQFYINGTIERLCIVLEGIDAAGNLTRTVKLLQ